MNNFDQVTKIKSKEEGGGRLKHMTFGLQFVNNTSYLDKVSFEAVFSHILEVGR